MDKMGKADLKVTVGLLVLGVAIGAVVLKIASPPPKPAQQITRAATAPGASVVPASPATPSPASQEPARTSQTNRITAATQEVLPQGLQGFHSWSGRVIARDASSLTIEFFIPETADGSRYHTEPHEVTWSKTTTFKRVVAGATPGEASSEEEINVSEMEVGDKVVVLADDQTRLSEGVAAQAVFVIPPTGAPEGTQSLGGPVYGKLVSVQGDTLTVTFLDQMPGVDPSKMRPLLITPGTTWSIKLADSAKINRMVPGTLTPLSSPPSSAVSFSPLKTSPAVLSDLQVGDYVAIYFSKKDETRNSLEASRVDVIKLAKGG